MNFGSVIQDNLGIPLNYIKIYSEDKALCLIHINWLKFIINGLKIPPELLEEDVADENLVNFFSSSNDIQLNSEWQLLSIFLWKKRDGKVFRFLKPHEKSPLSTISLTYAQLIHYVTKTNYKNLWEQAWKKYHVSEGIKKNKNKQKYNDALQELLHRLYKTERIEREDGTIIHVCNQKTNLLDETEDAVNPNLLQMHCAVETTECFLLVCEHITCTLSDCLMFSPHLLAASTVHPLFVVYQLLQVLRSIHNSGLFLGPVTLSSINVKENLWIKILPVTWKCLHHEAWKYPAEKHSALSHKQSVTGISCAAKVSNSQVTPIDPQVSEHSSQVQESGDKLYLSELVQGWVDGYISNFDYLISLNKLAGRQKDNPKCHYVMPWIMDFSVPEGGWRDLSKSKFRLNKGDKQLDLIYESAVEASGANVSYNSTNILQDSAITVPHHTSEVLSDITYYVYKARRMPKSFLCKHVRQKWVPAEYPATIERLQEWTPDECIPEFYSDPTIFYSIHPDLNDLGVPWWCDSPEDFIKKHRNALEGYHVSERLHQWIDLVFGYKLIGPSAVKSKNVCLPLVDCHTYIRNHGMIQLFSHPHPHKLSKSIFSRSVAPKTFRSIVLKPQDAKDSGDDETSSESFGKQGFLKGFRSKTVVSSTDVNRPEPRPENQTIVLPKDFNPLSTLSHYESLFTFQSWTGKRNSEYDKNKDCMNVNDISTHQYQVKDMLVLGCLISEIAVSSQCKTLPPSVSFQERYCNILKLLRLYKQDIPKSFQNAIQLLLQVSPSYDQQLEEMLSVPYRYPPISTSGLPLPSPHQLLLPHIRTIPFPNYFPDLYMFLLTLNKFSDDIKVLSERHDENTDIQKEIESLAEKKVCYAAKQLQNLLPALNTEGIELLTPYLQEMFENQHTALLSTWHMFGLVSQALGPQQTCKRLLTLLTKVLDTDKHSPKHLKLYHRSFILQIIIGLGLHNFLIHFTTILIEAIGGCKDYSSNDTESESVLEKEQETQQISNSDEYFPENEMFEGSLHRKLSLSEENLEMQQEIANDEDNEIFDLDIRDEEMLKDSDCNETLDQSSNLKDKNDMDKDIQNRSSFFIPCNQMSEKENSEKTSSDLWNARHDSNYSQSAPNLSSFSDWMNCEDDKLDYPGSPEKIRVESLLKVNENITDSSPNESIFHQDLNVSDVSAESMIWLAHRLGPVLSARYLTRNLLRMLTLCYDSSEKREIVYLPPGSKEAIMLSISCRWLKGDINAFKVLDCLSRIASLYGEHFIMIQYIKHISDLLHLCRKKIPASLESGLLGAMALLQHIIPYISDTTLMDHLQDLFVKDILHIVLRLISSSRLVYPGAGNSRAMVAFRILDVIYTIGLRIGFEMTRKHLSGILQKFFSCFDKVYDEKGDYKDLSDVAESALISGCCPLKHQALTEMRQTFTPEMAFLSYIPFCKLAGGFHMERTLKNDALIRNLCLQHDKNTALTKSQQQLSETAGAGMPHTSHNRNQSLGQDESFVSGVFGKNVNVIGNRLDVHLGEDSQLVMAMGQPVIPVNPSNTVPSTNLPKFDINLIKRKMDNCQRHLKGNWLAYWEHETGRSEKDYHFDFKQIKLQTFIGHTGAVRCIEVLDNENSFLTSSKDKTVKLWSLRSCGDGSSHIPCQWTYTQHRKSVFAVSFLKSLRLVGSCDSTVHIWDPFMGSCIKQLEPTKGSPITVLEAMPAPSMTFLAATTNSTVRFLDARTCKYMHEFKVNVGTTGLIRSLAVSPNGYWLAVGHSTGMLSVLDVRTGLVIGTWLGHEGEVLQLKAFNNSYFVTSSLDHSLTVWEFEDTQAKCSLKGPMEPVTSICFYGNEVISGTSGNRIGLHSSTDKNAVYTSTRLRSDTFKGVLTTMALLPLNRLLLLGTDNGNVVLLS
ncbi:WD repeat-containing protein 81-like [Argiope bruennichi]|uniref:WD repeat-containing protein 81 n=1 Tax=Argiope bruennichi TaxID=94029 RepID=A0A8T0F552_ARGBR|nr:WD repeat-containing protein 81-like [Argiope bruennichi]KAF8785971.1 WD repeat-containing protein 81 [Argiope bruennichi]